MLSTAKSATVGFSQLVQLFAPPTNPAYAPGAKIPFINLEKIFFGCQQCAQKYYGLVGFIMVRVTVSIRVSLV